MWRSERNRWNAGNRFGESLPRAFPAILLALFAGCASLAPADRAPVPTDRGPFSVTSTRTTLLDARRTREIPVRMYAPEDAPGKRPLVIFSHGLANGADGYSYLGEQWASHGFVVIHPQHHGNDIDLVREQGLLALLRSTRDHKHWRDRPEDVSFLLDTLAAIEGGSTDDPFVPPIRGRLDLERVAVAGHSYGAFTAVALAGFLVDLHEEGGVTDFRDERVDAVILMSMPKLRGAVPRAWGGVQTPALHITGTKDRSLLFRTFLRHRTAPFEQIDAPDQTLIVLEGATHSTFSDDERRVSRRRDEYIRATTKAATLFLKAVLENDAKARDEYAKLTFPGLAEVRRRP